MGVAEGPHGIEISATEADLIADYVPDSSGRYRIFHVKDPEASFDYLVTEINDGIERGGDTFAEIIERSPGWDSYPNRDEWMLAERFGSCPDLDENKGAGVVWIDGAAYLASWGDDVVSISTPEPAPPLIRAVITSGKLIVGERVEGYSTGPWFRSEWSGIYDGARPDEETGELYHYFRDGEINGIPQSLFGHPAAQHEEE